MQQVCFQYPSRELAKFRADEAAFSNGVITDFLDLSGTLPTDGWTHVAIELRADGIASLYINHEFIRQLPLRVRNNPETRWRIALFNDATDTEVLVRNLVLWPGMRYVGRETETAVQAGANP